MTNGNGHHRHSNPPSPLDSNQNYVNENDIPTPPPQSIQKYTPPPISKCTPPPAVNRYTPPQPQNVTRFTPPQTHFSQVRMPPSPQPVNKITPVVISVKIPQNPNNTHEQAQHRTTISVSPVVNHQPGGQQRVTNEQRTVVKIPTTAMVVKRKESSSSGASASPVMQEDGRIGQAVLRTVTVEKVVPRKSSPKNNSRRTPPILTIPPPPAPPPPPAMPEPSIQPKPRYNREPSREQSNDIFYHIFGGIRTRWIWGGVKFKFEYSRSFFLENIDWVQGLGDCFLHTCFLFVAESVFFTLLLLPFSRFLSYSPYSPIFSHILPYSLIFSHIFFQHLKIIKCIRFLFLSWLHSLWTI